MHTYSKCNARLRPTKGYNMKYQKDAPNSQIPFMRHVEGVKLRHFSGLLKAQKQKHGRLKKACKNGDQRGVMKQVIHGGPQQC